MTCLVTTTEIKKLSEEIKEPLDATKGLISLWQIDNHKTIDDYPSVEVLKNYRAEVRGYKKTIVSKIISGGQTGVDTIGLQVASALGIETGGTAPKGYLRETGIDDYNVTNFGLAEISDAEIEDYWSRHAGKKVNPYTPRTELNVRNSDGTVYFSSSDDSYGLIATRNSAKEFGKPFINNPTTEELKEWIKANNIKTLNIAGNRGSKLRNGNKVEEILKEALVEKESKESRQPIEQNGLVIDPSAQDALIDDTDYSAFDSTAPVTLEEQARVDMDFDPVTRRDRVTLIARLFSEEIDKATEEIKSKLSTRIANAKGREKLDLQVQLNTLNRYKVISEITPHKLFMRVKERVFDAYLSSTEDEKIAVRLASINASRAAGKYTEEQKLEIAKKDVAHKTLAYEKISNNFRALAEESSSLLVMTEGIRIDPSYIAPQDASFAEENENGETSLNDDSSMSHEEMFKDGWMSNYREVSSQESLSQAVRKAIRSIPKLDYRGKYDKDDLGNLRYLDADYVHAVLIDKLRDMITADDMIPLLKELAKTTTWVNQVIETLENDETLYSQFYQDFRKDFTPYWIQKRKMKSDGSFYWETVAINKPEGIYYLLDQWRDNYENGNQLDSDSVYNKDGEINIEAAKKGYALVQELNNKLSNLTTEERLELLNKEEEWNNLIKLFHMIGINVNPSVLRDTINNIQKAEGIEFTDPIMLIIPNLNIIFKGVSEGEVSTKVLEDGTEKRGDLINTFGSAYNGIARMLAEVTKDAIESSVRENEKSYYSHTTPSYLGKLIKQLKNVRHDEKNFQEFIDKEFKQYDWFFKDNRWRNTWIEQLASDPKMREGLNHKVVLNSNKVEYSDWDDLDYTIAMLTEYWGDPEDSRTKVKWAWYHVPILSDAPSAEFIRFRKYVNGVEFDEEGEPLTYDNIILDKLIDLVSQEYDRIMLVRERDLEFQKGNPNVSPIANFDIVRDKKTGAIKSKGGSEFKFLPALNSIIYDNGETFLDRLQSITENGNGADLKTFITETLRGVMERGFNEAYEEWTNMGLFTELPSGKCKYLPFMGQSQQNERIANALNKAKKVLDTRWNSKMSVLLNKYRNNLAIKDSEALEVFDMIKAMLEEEVTKGNMTANEFNSITRNFTVKNNLKEALREYYWNSTLATSQIIELTTTDLAFYKNIEDFQKRYKEVHAPALRMNTKATFHGELIGRDIERTIYLKDDEIKSTIYDDVRSVLADRVNKNEMSRDDANAIMAEFEKVNVADAQAYRSLSSYRAILGMSGQWTDEMETAYENFQKGIWSMADFNIIWQTKKPYVYTQINNISGIEGHTGIKTPVQHKNSEFLLLAMHDLIAGPLKQSPKLRAINDFMERNSIDVVQFESTTKVGKQGVVDINNAATYEEVIDILSETTGIKDAKASSNIQSMSLIENSNVVHKIPYEDYGIQTATPEHAIDKFQLIGTQIRKLITADISDDAILGTEEMMETFSKMSADTMIPTLGVTADEIVKQGGLTKVQWMRFYNAINTENIIQKFMDINEIFKDPIEIEKVLLEEIRGNQRYGMDMLKACTYNRETKQFNIPLFDPVQSQRIQTLLNSIIKSRVTKQKIRGGALIQVSNYGLSDKLNIVFKDKQGNLLSWESYKKSHKNATKDEYDTFVKEVQKNGELSIAYLECYMPAYSEKFYKPLMKPGTHELDITKLPDDLRKLIGYRVPTEDKYSMAPLYIKGFLPQQNGSAIMLPSEITTLSGSDFKQHWSL